MAEDFKTIREVGVAINGIYRQLTLLTWVVGACAALAVAVAGALYVKQDATAIAIARVEGKLDAIRDQLISKTQHGDASPALNAPPLARSAGP